MNAKQNSLSSGGLLARILIAVAVAGFGAAARADGFTSQRDLLLPPNLPVRLTDDPPLPDLTGAEKGCLVKLARQALEESVQTGKVLAAKNVPDTLTNKDYIAYMSVRQAGHQVGSCAGEGRTLVENIVNAALFLAGSKEFAGDADAKRAAVKSCVIELNILGPGQQLSGDGFKPLDQVARAVSPGVHGLAARTSTWDEKLKKNFVSTITMKESVAPVNNYTSEMVVGELLKKGGWTVPQVVAWRGKVTFFRFRAVHLLEQPGLEGYVELFRCAPLVAARQVTRDRLSELIDLIGQYLCYRQLESGLFSYSYSPAEGLYQKGDNATRQAGAAWAAARMARTAAGEKSASASAFELAAFKAIGGAKIRYLDKARTEACVGYTFAPDKESLGATALLLCAMMDAPNNQPLVALRDKVAAGVLRQQQQDGSFKLSYFDNSDEDNMFYYPGEALLALMKMHKQTGEKKYLDAVERSFDCYYKLFQEKPHHGFPSWHAQAWAMAYDATGKKQYRDFVFQLADYLVGMPQADDAADVYPDMLGGFLNPDGTAGVGSAAFLEGVVAAHRLAAKAPDAKRLKKYTESLRLGARFLDQLTFKKVDAFYCVTPKDVIGGVKSTPEDHTIRIDNCQHSVQALIGIREELFPQ